MTAWTNERLERELRALARQVEAPTAPDLAPAVGALLRAEGALRAPRPRARRPRARRGLGGFALRRPAIAAGLALVLAFSAVLAVSPGARQAVARWLGIRGARIETVPTLPTVPGTPTPVRSPIDLLLGERVGLAEARARAGFPIVQPAGLGPPDAVFLDDRLPGGRVTLAYRPTAEHPVSEHTGYGLVLSMFRGDLAPELIGKLVPEGVEVTPAEVRGRQAYFVRGEHVLTYLDPEGEVVSDTLRLAGPTLLWERGSLTLRLEGDLTLAEALRIAESVAG